MNIEILKTNEYGGFSLKASGNSSYEDFKALYSYLYRAALAGERPTIDCFDEAGKNMGIRPSYICSICMPDANRIELSTSNKSTYIIVNRTKR